MADDLYFERFDKSRHQREPFDCGEPALDDYLKTKLNQHMRRGVTVGYALADASACIARYVTLSAGRLPITIIPPGLGYPPQIEPTEPPPPDDGTGQSTPSDGETNEGAAEGEDAFEPQGFDGLYVYRASVENGFEEIGRISTRYNYEGEDYYYYYPSYVRGVFINDDVYAVTNLGIRTTPVDDMTSDPLELVLPRPEYDGGDVIIEPGIPVEGGGSSGSTGSTDAGGAAEEPVAADAG